MSFSHATGTIAAGTTNQADLLGAISTFVNAMGGPPDWTRAAATNQIVLTLAATGDDVHFVLQTGANAGASPASEPRSAIIGLPLRGTLPGSPETTRIWTTEMQVDAGDAWDTTGRIPAGEPDNPCALASSSPRAIFCPMDDTLATEYWISGESEVANDPWICVVYSQTSSSKKYWQSMWMGRLSPFDGVGGGWAMLMTQDAIEIATAGRAVDALPASQGSSLPALAYGATIFGHAGKAGGSSSELFAGWIMNHAETQWIPANRIEFNETSTILGTAADFTRSNSQFWYDATVSGGLAGSFSPLALPVHTPTIRTSYSGMVGPMVSPVWCEPDAAADRMRPAWRMPDGVYCFDKRGMPAGATIGFDAQTYTLLPAARADTAYDHALRDVAIALRTV